MHEIHANGNKTWTNLPHSRKPEQIFPRLVHRTTWVKVNKRVRVCIFNITPVKFQKQPNNSQSISYAFDFSRDLVVNVLLHRHRGIAEHSLVMHGQRAETRTYICIYIYISYIISQSRIQFHPIQFMNNSKANFTIWHYDCHARRQIT